MNVLFNYKPKTNNIQNTNSYHYNKNNYKLTACHSCIIHCYVAWTSSIIRDTWGLAEEYCAFCSFVVYSRTLLFDTGLIAAHLSWTVHWVFIISQTICAFFVREQSGSRNFRMCKIYISTCLCIYNVDGYNQIVIICHVWKQ